MEVMENLRSLPRSISIIIKAIVLVQVGFSRAVPFTPLLMKSSDLTAVQSLLKTPLAVSMEPKEEEPSPGAVQSDMMLTADQVAVLREEEETEASHRGATGPTDGRGRRQRKAVSDVARLWPRGIIPYEISLSSAPDRTVILEAIAHWQDKTCLEFKPFHRRLMRRLRHSSKIVFVKGSGCWSSVGRSHIRAQSISIGEGCAVLGTVVHEIGHAIGFFHEHSRPDRADHIRVHTENIHPRYRQDFRVLGWGRVATTDAPYDTESIMHYGSHYQSMNGEATITTIDPLQQANLGRKSALSFGDARLANIIYQCNAHCDLTATECLNGGYIGPDCGCVCPDQHSGRNCSVFTPSPTGCVQVLTEARGVVSSPNFPAAYQHDMHCIWQIKGAANTTVQVNVHSFAIEGGNGCPYDYFRYLQSDMRPLGPRHCGEKLPPTNSMFSLNEVVVEFQSDGDINDRGFQFEYQIRPM